MVHGNFIHLKEVLSQEELRQIREIVAKSNFVDGKATASGAALKIKNNQQLANSQENTQIAQYLLQALLKHTLLQRAAMPKMAIPPLISRYTEGMKYGMHVDSPLNGQEYTIRTDISVTLFLNEPHEYEGGELEIMTDAGLKSYKLSAGEAICYPTTQLHRVNKVISGKRLVAVTWIQCAVRDAHQREMIFKASEVIKELEEKDMANTEAHLNLQQLYSNLIRMWAEI
ncbi:Fe2+-dependent dioxygenase [Aureibacter tunicatorum]|uniref:PKHD-type hydroxylase n=1 Tax=Aureibacter tunicatorum TaxID=866807 RepID=A0AAE3XQD1_9BACT|nr:Fe2+-dependent dioxygenase [Aureibacter tunicatorum]MDR6240001.1 PKHD-type hydroxylase [Aureibacter tunicatorum]BDD04473.1 PKHD-type hydroxylase [Aureibacter tunicatorum]